VHLEFPVEGQGTEINCPQCGQRTVLVAPLADEPADAEATPTGGLQAVDMAAAFGGPVARTPVSPFYRTGLCLVALMMILLPAIYLAMIGAAAWATYYWGAHFTWLLAASGGSGRVYVLKAMLYGTPLFIGGVLVFFMVKPLFARRGPHAQPLALNPGAEPAVFAFVTQICQAVGAPFPKRIDVDCQLNASASFRRGFSSFFGNDLVLTIGLPLVAGFTLRELAGVIAHEFGHFTQGFGMRLTYVIRSVNAWFARVIYERDTWDLTLEEWAQTEEWHVAMVAGCARLAVWFSRLLLKLLMLIGHGISCFMLRQMEYDADSYEVKLVGTETFEITVRRFHLLGHALGQTYKDIRTKWNINRALPDDFPTYLLQHYDQVPMATRTQMEDRLGLAATGLFDTHPSDGDRIRCARRAGEAGVFHLDGPATALFSNFPVLSGQITLLHYSDDLGLPMEVAILQPLAKDAPDVPESEKETETQNAEEHVSQTGLRLRLRRPG